MSDALATATRLSHGDRRDAFLDAAAELLVELGASGITMDAVAARANVSRPLVYKHFANRDELLVELHRRERDRFDAAVRAALVGVHGFESVVRTTARAVLATPARQARIFAALLHAQPSSADLRDAARSRRDENRAFFARLAAAEFDIDEATADAAVAVFYNGLESLVGWNRGRPTADRDALVDLYVKLVVGGFQNL